MKQPFEKTWWVKEEQLLAGCFPGTELPNGTKERLEILVSAGIRTFISLQTPNERNATGAPFPHYEPVLSQLESDAGEPLHFHRFPVVDCTAPTLAVMSQVLDVIDESIAQGKPVYVHCWGGHGRTGSVVGCWLVRHGVSGSDALKTISELRKIHPELVDEPAPQVFTQYDLVRRWGDLDPKKASGKSSRAPVKNKTIAAVIDPEVKAYLESAGLTAVDKPDPRHFQFQLGQEFHAASDGGMRRIRGFCLGRDKLPLYIVELPGNKLTTKTPAKAHREYVPVEQRKTPAVAKADAIPSSTMTPTLPLFIRVEPLSLHDRYLGAMFGLACGDAVGTTLEFSSPGTFTPIHDMIGGGPFSLKAGQWTDDTSMALCLAESLVHLGESNAEDQMRRYVAWWKQGHLSSTGHCFDIGNATRAALTRFIETGNPMAGSSNPKTAGNGSLMRLAPVPLAFRLNVDTAVAAAAQCSMTTHAAAETVDACRLMTVLMIGALGGASKEELLHENQWEKSLHNPAEPLAPKILSIAKGSYKTKMPPEIKGAGYVVDCLEAALWAFYHHDTYEKAVLAAANLGDDADTTAAVCGQLAGAYYGMTGIPTDWLECVAMRDTIAQLARGLLRLSTHLNKAGVELE